MEKSFDFLGKLNGKYVDSIDKIDGAQIETHHLPVH
jgi:hypothetical protein